MEKIYFVGINGIGMSGLAKIMKCQGYDVIGADLRRNYVTEELENLGITVYSQHEASHMQGRDSLVVSSAIHADNPEYQYANEQHIPVMKRGELLARLLNEKTGIAIAGTHGKTTSSSMLSAAMLNLAPTIVVGGILPEISSNAKMGESEYFIAEADESDNSFLYMKPKYAVITNIEEDHLENHGCLDNIKKSFQQFVEQTEKEVVLCKDCPNVRSLFSESDKITSYAMEEEADIMAKDLRVEGGTTFFDVWIRGEKLGRFALAVPGKHNVLNALPVIYFANKFGVAKEEIQDKLLQFRGSKRRYDVLYWEEKGNRKVIDDYAHHPTEIRATLSGLLSIEHGKKIGVFQGHRYSRIKFLLEQFKECFQGLDELILMPIFSAGEEDRFGVDEEEVANLIQGPKVSYIAASDEIEAKLLEELKEEDRIVLFMGAGDISNLAHKLAEQLQKTGE